MLIFKKIIVISNLKNYWNNNHKSSLNDTWYKFGEELWCLVWFDIYCVSRCTSNEALPRPISKRKDKEYKKKSKAISTLNVVEAEVGALKTSNALPEVASYNAIVPTNTSVLDEKPGWSFRESQKAGNECTRFFLSYESIF